MAKNEHGLGASQALLSAALGGLLSVAAACTTQSPSSSSGSTDPTATTNGDTPVPATTCDAGVSPNPMVTSTTSGSMTQDQFKSQCDARHGIFEIQPHCGGSNACRGMSYDSGKQTLTEHSCRATNTCGGFSCVICG